MISDERQSRQLRALYCELVMISDEMQLRQLRALYCELVMISDEMQSRQLRAYVKAVLFVCKGQFIVAFG